MFMLADGSSSTQSRFDLMVEVLNTAETAISEIGRALVFIRKELGSGPLNGKPICLFRLHLFSRHLRQTCCSPTRTQDPISLEMSCLVKHNLLTDQICLVLQKFPHKDISVQVLVVRIGESLHFLQQMSDLNHFQ